MDKRFHDMDFCRALFMYCGILFHCGLIYGAGQDWRVVSDQTSSLLSLLSNFLHHFRMEAFYLVSGFFFLLILQKQRPKFLKERVLRALIPMLVVGFTLNFAMNFASDNRTYTLNTDYFLMGKWQAHLWFLGNLIVYFICFLPLAKYLQSSSSRLSPSGFASAIVWIFALALVSLYISTELKLTTVLFINFGYLFYYSGFFVIGLLAFAYRTYFYQLIEIKCLPLYLFVYTGLQALCILNSQWPEQVLVMVKQVSHLPLVFAAFALLCRIGNTQSKVIRFLSDASYTIYLFHMPLLVIFYVYIFADIQLGAVPEYLLLVTLVFVVSSLIHVFIVQKSPIGKMLLNGVMPTANSNDRSKGSHDLKISKTRTKPGELRHNKAPILTVKHGQLK